MPARAKKAKYTRHAEPSRSKMMRIPAPLYEEAKTAVEEGVVGAVSVTELVVESVKYTLRDLRRKAIDEAFRGMATDAKYQAEMLRVSSDFEASDWHAFRQAEEQKSES